MTHYRFKRGLGKDEIGIAVYCCVYCKATGVTLYRVSDNDGNKAYACGDHKILYKVRKKLSKKERKFFKVKENEPTK